METHDSAIQDSSAGATEVSIIIPAFREEQGIHAVVEGVRRVMDATGRTYEMIVVDDGSDDGTAAEAQRAGARIISHPYNIGNGAAVKTGIRNALGDILVLLDGDGQHAPDDIPRLLEKMDVYDMAVGARTVDSDASFHRKVANRIYNRFATYMCKRRIEDLTSGFRAIKTKIARQFVSLLPNEFSYPTTITMSLVRSGYSLAYVPIKAHRSTGRSKIRIFRDGSRFFLIIVKIATLFSPMRVFLPVSAFMFLAGLGYGLFRIFFLGGRYGPTSAMLMTVAVVVFMVGLVSEQVAQLRFDRNEAIRNPQGGREAL
ncbi:MAG: glycosyltransferase family 2 protein [Deltaproteobacteria bacterium]|nr:glycosyltransferase family 2 protein [Deltaproteobacteria bacterium]